MSTVIVAKRRESREFLELVRSLGHDIFAIIEFRDAKNPGLYLSRGKVEEIEEHLTPEVDMVLVDGILKSSQWYALERKLKCEVHDRIRLIIDIFAERAKSREAMLQVEYAKLKYEIPFVKEMIHHQRLSEHAGWMGGGEYEVADYYEMIRKRITRIEHALKKIERDREERRKRRRSEGFVLVGIAGYTNAGKSTLLRALTSTDRIIESRMFSTLATKTSRLGKERILITDTVGFVEDMPPWLIRAFNATLEEIYGADVVLLLMDGCDSVPEFARKYRTTMDIIEGRVNGVIVPVINKVDCAENLDEKSQLLAELGEPCYVSALTGAGIDELVSRIRRESHLDTHTLVLSGMDDERMNYIRRFGKISGIWQEERGVKVQFTMRRELYESMFSS